MNSFEYNEEAAKGFRVMNKEKTLSELRYYRRNNQITFLNQEAIDAVLMYVGSEEVSP